MIRLARPPSLPAADTQFVVVEASAGTGKTYFLEHRVIDLIIGAQAELGQILLVTFTDKAVAELRLRIRDLLDRLSRAETSTATEAEPHWVLDDEARRRLRAAVTAFDHAPIFTIHGFCHRVLVEDAFAAHRLFEQHQVADEVAFDAAFQALLRERFARLSPDRELLAAFLETGRNVDRLRAILLGCARAGHDARVRRHLDAGAIRDVVARLHEVVGTGELRAAILRELPTNGNEVRWIRGWLHDLAADLPALDATPARQAAAIGEIRETIEKLVKYAAKSAAHAALAAALRGAASAVSLDEAIAAEMLPAIMERITRDKEEHGLFDYDDMLQLVWQALRDERRGAELASRLRDRTPWAMIDEFQDTDPVQWSIFRSVWMQPESSGLTIVGDPKQAIYGFRGADVGTYLDARDELLRVGATRVALDVNRRSTEGLVEAVNTILAGDGLTPLMYGQITYDQPVKPAGEVVCEDVRPPVVAFALRATGKTNGELQRAALAGAIGQEIEELRDAPPVWTSRGRPQPFALGHVMVLTRTNRDSTEIAAALRARGLPCALVEPERLFETREADELASVLAAIAAPRDRSARLRALRTRFFDVPWADLMQVVDAPDHHPLIARIFDWAQLASRRAYETLFRRLVEDSRYAERALVLGNGERAVTNTWHLIELLLGELARARSDLHELVSQLRRWIADDTSHPDERDVQRAETDADAVRILTIHKAKGLESPYVFVYGGTSPPPKGDVKTLRDPAGRAILVGALDDTTSAALEAANDAENQRLAYVALTRAQVRLYLPIYGEGGMQNNAAYEPIQRCLAPLAARARIGGRALFEMIEVAIGADEGPEAPLEALASFRAPAAPELGDAGALAALPAERGGLLMFSYTRLARDLEDAVLAARPGDALAIEPAEFDVDDPGGEVGDSELPPGADSGLLLHDVLEAVDVRAVKRIADPAIWANQPDVAVQLADAARARGIDPRFLPHAAALVHATLATPLRLADGHALPPLAEAPAFAREVEFSYPLPLGLAPADRRGLVRGFIDALVAWDDDLWVLDYKSDVLSGNDPVAAAKRRVKEHYAVQARLYAIAADRMRGSRRLAGLLFAFVRTGVVVPIRIEHDTLATWAAWLARVTAPPPEVTA